MEFQYPIELCPRRSNHSHHHHPHHGNHTKQHGVKGNTRISTEGYQDNSSESGLVKSVSHSFSDNFDLAAVKAKYEGQLSSENNDRAKVLSRGKRQSLPNFDLATIAKAKGQSRGQSSQEVNKSRVKRQIRRGYRGLALPRFAGIEHRFLREKIVGELGYPEGRLDRRAPPGFRAAGFTPVSLTDFSIASTGTAGRNRCRAVRTI